MAQNASSNASDPIEAVAPGSAMIGRGVDGEQGRTTIADGVVQKIAGIAAREVSGVHNLGSGSARAFGALRERIPGSAGPATTPGVSVEVGEKQAAIDLDIVVEYGVAITALAWASAIGRDAGPKLQMGPAEAQVLPRVVRLIATTRGPELALAQAPS